MLKRGFDILSSLVGIAVFFPFFLVIGILIKIDSPGMVFFKQKRIGRNFKPFNLYKFRTMVTDAEKKGPLITSINDSRITAIGRLLRRTKLDEMPQLFNVLKGDMSLVGPRPEVLKYVTMFKDEYKDVLTIRPGITDYASIAFSNEEEILRQYDDTEDGYVRDILPAKIELYKKYLKERGFLTDLKLVFLTLYKMVK